MNTSEHEWKRMEHEWKRVNTSEHEWEMREHEWEMSEHIGNTNGKIGILIKIGQIWQFGWSV